MNLRLALIPSAGPEPAPFCKGGKSGQPLVASIGAANHGTVN